MRSLRRWAQAGWARSTARGTNGSNGQWPLKYSPRKCPGTRRGNNASSAKPDVKLQLRALAEGRSQEGIAAPVVVRRKNRERLLLAALAGTAMVAALLGFLYLRPPVKPRVVRSSVRAMENSTFLLAGVPSGLALSPDGLRLVYVARDSTNNKLLLWVRPLDSLQAQPLSGTEGAFFPFWSPDSQSISFLREESSRESMR